MLKFIEKIKNLYQKFIQKEVKNYKIIIALTLLLPMHGLIMMCKNPQLMYGTKLHEVLFGIMIIFVSLFFFLNLFTLLVSFGINSLKKSFYILLLVSSAVAGFFTNFYGIGVTKKIMLTAVDAPQSELLGVLSFEPLLYIIITGIIPSYIIFKQKIKKHSHGFLRAIATHVFYIFFSLFAVIFLANLNTDLFAKNIIKNVYLTPVNVITSTINMVAEKFGKRIGKTKIRYEIQGNFTLNTQKDLNFVLIIGESARAKSFEVLGYQKPNNPNIKTIQNLHTKVVQSCGTLTMYSVPCILSFMNEKSFSLNHNEKSIVSLFKKLGFATYTVQTNSGSGADDLFNNFFLESGNYIKFSRKYDGDKEVLDAIKKIANEKNNKPKFIIIHQYGSHYRYVDRYPKEFEKFQPACQGNFYKCSKPEVVNAYDNSIYYTDYTLSEINKIFKNKNTFFVYTSDHGESLGENGIYTHGLPKSIAPKVQYEVPLFIWYSDIYKQKNPQKVKNIANFFEENKENMINHDYIVHSILGCAGVKGDRIEQDKNICH